MMIEETTTHKGFVHAAGPTPPIRLYKSSFQKLQIESQNSRKDFLNPGKPPQAT
jgi:hypothetical protein